MSRWTIFWIFVIGCIVGAMAVSFLMLAAQVYLSVAAEPSPPKIAGHDVPAEVFKVDFSRRYNLKLDSRYGQDSYDNCLIKGFTYDEKEGGRGISYFEKWLVVELADGRLVYLSPHNIRVIEEAAEQHLD